MSKSTGACCWSSRNRLSGPATRPVVVQAVEGGLRGGGLVLPWSVLTRDGLLAGLLSMLCNLSDPRRQTVAQNREDGMSFTKPPKESTGSLAQLVCDTLSDKALPLAAVFHPADMQKLARASAVSLDDAGTAMLDCLREACGEHVANLLAFRDVPTEIFQDMSESVMEGFPLIIPVTARLYSTVVRTASVKDALHGPREVVEA